MSENQVTDNVRKQFAELCETVRFKHQFIDLLLAVHASRSATMKPEDKDHLINILAGIYKEHCEILSLYLDMTAKIIQSDDVS